MNFLDILIVVVAGVFTLRGFFRGFVREIVSLAVVIAAIFLAGRFNHLPAPLLKGFIEGEASLNAVGYLLVFVLSLILGWVVVRLLASFIKVSTLGWANAALGAIFGLVEGAVVCMALLLLLSNFMPGAEFLKESKLTPRVNQATTWVLARTPQSLKDTLTEVGLVLPLPAKGTEDAPTGSLSDSPSLPEPDNASPGG